MGTVAVPIYIVDRNSSTKVEIGQSTNSTTSESSCILDGDGRGYHTGLWSR